MNKFGSSINQIQEHGKNHSTYTSIGKTTTQERAPAKPPPQTDTKAFGDPSSSFGP